MTLGVYCGLHKELPKSSLVQDDVIENESKLFIRKFKFKSGIILNAKQTMIEQN